MPSRFRMRHPLSALPMLLLLLACQPSGDGSTVEQDEPEPAAVVTPGEPASAWDAAAARGVVFRAVGNEPGWYAELDRGTTPALHATLDYGDRRVEVPRARALDGDALGYHGTATDGTAVVLRTRREACSDGMSDRTYDSSVTLEVGDATYRGCGVFLGD